jgi:hypothetical protein
MMDLLLLVLFKQGYEVSKCSSTVLLMLKNWLRTHAYEHIQYLGHVLDFSTDQPVVWADTYHMIEILAEQIKPHVLKGGMDEQNFTHLQQQVLIDLNKEEFTGLSHWTTIIGQKPFLTSPGRRRRRGAQHMTMTPSTSQEK